MRFVVPQIEKETKIVGPLTWKQFLTVAIPSAISFLLYFSLGKKNLGLFLLVAIPLISLGIILALVKIEGKFLPALLRDFLKYQLFSKKYFWKRKEKAIKIIEAKKIEAKKEKVAPKLKGRGKLTRLKARGFF